MSNEGARIGAEDLLVAYLSNQPVILQNRERADIVTVHQNRGRLGSMIGVYPNWGFSEDITDGLHEFQQPLLEKTAEARSINIIRKN